MPDVSELLPQRPPFLMVDSVLGYGAGNSQTLVAAYAVSGSDPVFADGYSPTHWPSVHVVEGLGQSCQILSLLGHRDRPVADDSPGDTGVPRAPSFAPPGLLAAVDVEIHGFAKPGDRLRYHVTQTHALDELFRFRATAYVKERMIASGVMVGAVMR